MPRPLSELAAIVGGQIEGDSTLSITGLAGLEEAKAGQLSFYGNKKYKKQLEATHASAVLIDGDAAPERTGVTWIRVKAPHLAFARIAQAFFPPRAHSSGISSQAAVHPSAKVHASATVMAHVAIEAGAVVGPRAVLYPGVYVGPEAHVGEDTVLYSNVTIAERCVVGKRCIIHSSAVIGADGFGFALDLEKPEHVKIPQVGIARLEDDVELGANSCVDRATLGETVVGRGSKIDNLVQVAHNVKIGPLTILCAQVGISGSAKLGQGVVLGGQVGVNGHIEIGDLAQIGPKAGVVGDVEPGSRLLGAPAIEDGRFMRAVMTFEKLPELAKELRALKKRIEQLEQGEKKNE